MLRSRSECMACGAPATGARPCAEAGFGDRNGAGLGGGAWKRVARGRTLRISSDMNASSGLSTIGVNVPAADIRSVSSFRCSSIRACVAGRVRLRAVRGIAGSGRPRREGTVQRQRLPSKCARGTAPAARAERSQGPAGGPTKVDTGVPVQRVRRADCAEATLLWGAPS